MLHQVTTERWDKFWRRGLHMVDTSKRSLFKLLPRLLFSLQIQACGWQSLSPRSYLQGHEFRVYPLPVLCLAPMFDVVQLPRPTNLH